MKKCITLAALLAAGTTFANAEDYTGTFAWTSGSVPTLALAGAPLTLTLDNKVTIGGVVYCFEEATAAEGLTLAAPKTNSVYSNALTPDTNVGSGGSWSISFTITNTGKEALTLESITFDAFAYNSGGKAQNADELTRDITFALTGGAEVSVVHSFGNTSSASNWDTNPTLTFTNPLEIVADGSAEFTLSVSKSDSVGCFIGLSGLTVSTVPEPSAFGMLAGLGALALVAARRRRK